MQNPSLPLQTCGSRIVQVRGVTRDQEIHEDQVIIIRISSNLFGPKLGYHVLSISKDEKCMVKAMYGVVTKVLPRQCV